MIIDGPYHSDPLAVPDELTGVDVAATRCTKATPHRWADPSCFLDMQAWVSLDGITWTELGGWGAYGGIHVRRDGIEAPHTRMLMTLPHGHNRQMKWTLTASHPTDVEVHVMGLMTVDGQVLSEILKGPL